MKILIVDDSKTMRHLTQTALKDMGHSDLVVCEGGEEALGELKAQKIDLILLDWHMPKMNGLEFLQRIKSSGDTKAIPVIMVTMEQDKKKVEQAILEGVENYIIKPLKKDVLAEKIKIIAQKYNIK